MSQNLYFKSSKFGLNKEFASFIEAEFKKYGFNPSIPVDHDYMYSIELSVNDDTVHIYLGKSDEDSIPPLWQVWPEQKVSFIKKIFKKANKDSEAKVINALEEIINNINDVSHAEWGI